MWLSLSTTSGSNSSIKLGLVPEPEFERVKAPTTHGDVVCPETIQNNFQNFHLDACILSTF